MSTPRARVLELIKSRCRVFSTTFNPEMLRTGNKILRQRLKGPALTAYYPRKVATLRDLEKAYVGMDFPGDDGEQERLEHLSRLRARGAGAPKKKKTFEESRKYKAMQHKKPKE